ncbi:hypothetical protein WAE59_08405 [Pedobacter sp. GR22-6]
MQDSEFDRLFKDQLGAAEVQPSAGLWAKIETELEPKRKRSFPVYWMAAAAALLIVGLSLLMPEGEKIRLQAPAALSANKADVAPVVEKAMKSAGNELAPVKAAQSTPLVIAPRLTAADIKKSLEVLQPKAVNEHPVDKVDERPAVVAKIPVQVREEVMIASAEVADRQMASEVKEVEQPERRSIRNVGDLVNYVVDKVDKRDNKVVKFNTDDDDNSSLIAINIGFIKLNSKRHK